MARERVYDRLLERTAYKLKEIREKKGMSQEQVYYDTKLNIGRIEVGKTNISLTTLAILCDYYGVALDEFFKGIKTK